MCNLLVVDGMEGVEVSDFGTFLRVGKLIEEHVGRSAATISTAALTSSQQPSDKPLQFRG